MASREEMTSIRDPDVRRVRAMAMLQMRLAHVPAKQIAAHFGVHEDTVYRSIAWARREGLLQDAEEAIIGTLVPKAIKVYTEALDKDDVFVAKDVLGHLMKIADRIAARKEHEEDMSLSVFLKTRRAKRDDEAAATVIGSNGHHELSERAPLDIEIIEAGPEGTEPPADAAGAPPVKG